MRWMTRGTGRKPGASLYTLKRLCSLSRWMTWQSEFDSPDLCGESARGSRCCQGLTLAPSLFAHSLPVQIGHLLLA
jgi:hypothetical protein